MTQPPEQFEPYQNKAKKLLESANEVDSLTHRADRKLRQAGSLSAKFVAMKHDLWLMIGLLRAWASGDYTGVSTRSLVAIVGAVLYFVTPLDAIPDFLFGFGLIDDAAIITYVLSRVKGELEAYAAWQQNLGETQIDPPGGGDRLC